MSQPWRTALYNYILTQAQPPEKFGHRPRLYALTQQIGPAPPILQSDAAEPATLPSPVLLLIVDTDSAGKRSH